MAITSGFYDSSSGDRVYTAEEFGSIFDGLISDGVYGNYGSKFAVTAGSGKKVNVGSGRGWFNHTWILNDSLYTLPADEDYPTAHPNYDRNDVVAIMIDKSARQNSIVLLKGSEENGDGATNIPSDTSSVFYYPIANILVPHGATSSSQYTITSLIGRQNTNYKTKWVYGITLDPADYYTYYTDGVNAQLATLEAELDEWKSGIEVITGDGDGTAALNAITAIGNRVTTIEGDLNTASTGLKAKVSTLETDNAALHQEDTTMNTSITTLLGYFSDKFPYLGSASDNINLPKYTMCRYGGSSKGTRPDLGTSSVFVISEFAETTEQNQSGTRPASNFQLAMSSKSNKIALRRKQNATTWYSWRYIEFKV